VPDAPADGGEEKSNVFTTLPGILTGVAALITATATLAGVLLTRGGDGDSGKVGVETSSQSPPQERVAFVSDRGENSDVYSMSRRAGTCAN
jgi:hypothetical protein